ncbi:MAG TPA: SRPBCC family protein [Rhodocyclaceae bacterium]|jgi:uncharacterized protein YndB with AHSA1/START domain|nr:SRPBCC family protein [Rhodocyclaceae bacterium]
MSETTSNESFGTFPAPNTVHLERILPGPIERVWAYLTEPEKRAKWFSDGPMAAAIGGAVELHFHNNTLGKEAETPERFKKYDGHTISGYITRYDPPHTLGFTFGQGEDASEVLFELSTRPNGVLLVLKHSRLSSREGLLSVSTGWHTHLGVLLAELSGSTLQPFWARFVEVEQEYDKRIPSLS